MKKIAIKKANEVIYYDRLKNGLDVYMWPSKYGEDIHMSLTVKYGSIHTDFSMNNKVVHVPNGIAHFLEHIKFNEKSGVTAHEYYGKLGSYVNAYTTYDHTSYEVVCTENFKENLTHLLYFVNNPYFNKSLIEKEKPIIIEEAKMVLDNPYNIGYKILFENIYVNDHKKYLVTGNVEDIKSINLENVLNVFDSFYAPNNMFLTITGHIDPDETIKILNNYYSSIENEKQKDCKYITTKEPDYVKKEYEIKECAVSSKKLLLAYKISKKLFDYDDIHLKILFTIILNCNFGLTSLFYEDLIKKDLIEDMFYGVSVEKNHVIITFEVSTDYPDKVALMIKEKMKNLQLTKEDFIRKNKIYIASTLLGYDDPAEVNSEIRYDIITYGKIINNMNHILNKLSYNMGCKVIKAFKKCNISQVNMVPSDK